MQSTRSPERPPRPTITIPSCAWVMILPRLRARWQESVSPGRAGARPTSTQRAPSRAACRDVDLDHVQSSSCLQQDAQLVLKLFPRTKEPRPHGCFRDLHYLGDLSRAELLHGGKLDWKAQLFRKAANQPLEQLLHLMAGEPIVCRGRGVAQ